MNSKWLLCLLLGFWFLLPIQARSQNTRQKIIFNANWKFYRGDVPNGADVNLNDKTWRKLNLPHDWSIEGPFSKEWASGTGYLPGGIGWYRKSFSLPTNLQGKKVFLYFDGVYKNSEVWVNGHLLGKRPNGYIAFQYEITPHLLKNGPNTLAVKVDHTDFADSRWYPGSGIYRNVYLIVTEPVHIDVWGVAFTTPEVTTSQATAQIAVSVNNQTAQNSQVQVKTELRNQQNKIVATAQNQVNVKANAVTDANLTFPVANPELWSIEQPNLYKLQVSLWIKGKQTDFYEEQVGFRSFRFDAQAGFFLNNQNLKLKGICVHHDAGALGAAVPPEVWERRLKALKEVGCNAIRMSHYPHQDYLYALCDKLGFLVIDEAFDEWEIGKNKWIEGWNVGKPGKDGYNQYFKEWADRDLRDMILRNRNRPSIIMWSIGNEIDYPNDPYSHEVLSTGRNPQIYGRGYQPNNPPASRLGELARHLVAVAKKYDTSRPITAALAGVVMSNFTDYPKVLDVVGYNYQEYRYPEDHEKYPERIIYGSENGKNLDAWQAVANNPYISGQFLWTGFDFMGEARSWPARSSGAGILDLAGFPKPEYYFRQSLWTDKPMVYMTASKIAEGQNHRNPPGRATWNWAPGDKLKISCFTNTDAAELFLNGQSLGKQIVAAATGRVLSWEVPYQPGELVVKGYKNGLVASQYKLKTTGAPAAIQVITDKKVLSAASQGLAHLEINIIDENGNLVPEAEIQVTVNIEGPATLLGLESGSLTSHEDYKAPQRKAYRGKLLAYIQAQPKAGNIKITLAAPGLKTNILQMKAE